MLRASAVALLLCLAAVAGGCGGSRHATTPAAGERAILTAWRSNDFRFEWPPPMQRAPARVTHVMRGGRRITVVSHW
jgi:hypothetical protein